MPAPDAQESSPRTGTDMPSRKLFDTHPSLSLLRLLFFVARVLPSAVTARLALQLFLTPGRRPITTPEVALRQQAEREEVLCRNRTVVTYRWGTGSRRILLCHAWGGRGTQFGHFVAPLLAQGYSVIAFDAPAHGASPGRRSDMVEYVSTVGLLGEKYGPFEAVIGHSFGAGNLLWAQRDRGLVASKIVLIGCFVHGIWVIEAFGEALRLPVDIVRRMCAVLEKKYPGELVWERLSMLEILNATSVPLLVVHDRDDSVIPFAHAEQLHGSACGPSELFATSGLGHKRLLGDPGVVDRVVAFISASPSGPTPQGRVA